MNVTTESEYKKAREEAKAVYTKIGHVPCPALGGALVAFTSSGFNHLVRKGRVPRPRSEQMRRFALVPYIEHVLRSARAPVSHERRETKEVVNRHGDKVHIKLQADFWIFSGKVNGKELRVVVRELSGNRHKHFFSVMDTYIKKPRS